MTHLSAYLLDADARPAVVADTCALIDREVAATAGLSGMAIRSAHRLVTGIRPGMLASAVDSLLGPFADRLDPYYQEHLATGKPLAQVLLARRASMADALLGVTDDRARRTNNVVVRRAYQQVRGSARRHVEAAAPGIAALIDAHTPSGPAQRRPDQPPAR